MKRYIKRYGIPKSVCLDKHTTYKSWAEPTIEEQLNDQKPMSHFEKSLAELAIEVIHANSPRPKAGWCGSLRPSRIGWSERCGFRGSRAWMRQTSSSQPICRSTTGNSRNRPLQMPISTGRTAQQRARSHSLHQRGAHDQERLYHLSEQFTLYQIEQPTRAKKVTVEERLDGTLHVTYNEQDLRFRESTKMSAKDTSEAPLLMQEEKQWTPPADHSWKKIFLAKRRRRGQPIAAL